jgi:hypothetical protein
LNPDRGLREEVDAADVVPVRVADHDVRDVLGRDAGEAHGLVGPQVVGERRKLLPPLFAVEAAVEENDVPAAADQPDDHRDVDLLALRRADHEIGDGEVANGPIANGLDRIVGSLRRGRIANGLDRIVGRPRRSRIANGLDRVAG